METITQPVTRSKVVKHKPDFGNGRYTPLMEEIYRDSQGVFGLSEAKAEKLSKQIASDFGAVMSSVSFNLSAVKMGSKLSKDGKLTIGEAASKVKNVTITNALFALRALKYAGDAGQNGFLFNDTEWAPVKALKDYFDTL